MTANDHDAEPQSGWEGLEQGLEVEVRESTRTDRAGAIGNLRTDGSFMWVQVDGHPPSRMFLEEDPVVILPEVPDAF